MPWETNLYIGLHGGPKYVKIWDVDLNSNCPFEMSTNLDTYCMIDRHDFKDKQMVGDKQMRYFKILRSDLYIVSRVSKFDICQCWWQMAYSHKVIERYLLLKVLRHFKIIPPISSRAGQINGPPNSSTIGKKHDLTQV